MHQFNLESNAELHRRLNSGVSDLSNDELFTFHAVRAMLNELVRTSSHLQSATAVLMFTRIARWEDCERADICVVLCAVLQVESMIECDILVWGGDTRWLVALRIEGANQIQSVNGPIY